MIFASYISCGAVKWRVSLWNSCSLSFSFSFWWMLCAFGGIIQFQRCSWKHQIISLRFRSYWTRVYVVIPATWRSLQAQGGAHCCYWFDSSAKNFHNVKIYMQFGMRQKAYLATGWGNDTRLLCYKRSPKLNELGGIYRRKDTSYPTFA